MSDPLHPKDVEVKPTSSDQRYLEKLEFNPELKKTWLNFFVSNFRVVILLIILVSAAGLYAFFKLPRESNPEVKIPIAVVTTLYPGASPSDVEELVTKKIETRVSGLKGLKKVTSNSANSFSSITVEFDAKEDLKDSIRSLRDKVVDAKKDLPTDAKDPVVTEISLDDQPVWTIVLTGPYDGFTMRKYAEDLRDELEKIPGVREIQLSGGDEKEFEVAYDPDKLVFYGVSADQANQAIAATNLAIPAGNFDGQKFVYPIRTDGKVYTAEDIGSIAVSHTDSGSVILVRDLAQVKEKAIKKTTLARLSIAGSKPSASVTLSLIKRTGSSILDTVDQAKTVTDKQVASFGAGVKYDVTFDTAKQVRKDFEQLTHDFLLTLLLVFGVLFIIVGLKEAFVAGLAIPLVFFVSFASLYLLGISLNFLSLFSLILALGLLVDDAIVVVSATKQYLNTGKYTPEEAVLLVLNDFKVVLTTTTLTTVWAFLPLLFSTGIMGEYLKSIPITVSITLIGSLFVALMINHPLAAVLERIRLTKKFFLVIELLMLALAGVFFWSGGWSGYLIGTILTVAELWAIWWYENGGREAMEENAKLAAAEWESDDLVKEKLRYQASHENPSLTSRLMHGILHFNKLLPIYEKYLKMVVSTKQQRRKTVAAVILALVVAVALPATGIVRTEFFPPSDSDYVYMDIRMPVGQKLDETDKIVRQVEEKLLNYSEIANFSTIVGHSSPMAQSRRDQANVAAITITLKDKEFRKIKSYDFAQKLRQEIANPDGSVITVSTLSGGPPAGAAFEARIKGDDLKKLDQIAHELEPKLESLPGVVNVDISLKDSAPEYTFVLDPIKLEQNSLNAAYVGSALRMAISGTEVSTVIREGKETKIVARFGEDRIPKLEDVQNLQILNLKKQPVFLKDVAQIELKPSVDSVTRIDQKRTVLLSADAGPGTNSNQILAGFQSKISDYQMPTGYSIVYGGQNETNQESVLSVIRAMIIAMILIVSTLIIQFNSFKKAFIVLGTIPLALIGVFFGMALLNVPLSFPGLIGVLALFGIVVKNAIILMDKIDLNIRFGIPFFEAVVDAGKSRLEAIFITSICTICGILPITLSKEPREA
ncbi:MAG: efflux RND transporter permease subunit [Patescibacteria group bacterium]|nr:efflux RND transporter permease subunit [Patescibacteria group bacterium]